jgi:TetR/AcrR family transcriptional regulator
LSEPLIIPQRENISTADRILDVATVSFARKGYHGTSIRDIAREVDLSVATLYYYAQNKDDLYLKVFEKQYKEEARLIGDILATADENTTRDPATLRQLLYQLIDALIDRSALNPDVVRLWTRRWLEKPEQTESIEAEYSIPLYRMVESLLNQAESAGVINPGIPKLDIISYSFTWLHYGYFGLGQLTFRTQVNDPLRPEQVEEFRAFVHMFVDRMLRFSDQQ